MADNIPFEIQVEIIKRLPVKSVLQFRQVSKTWKSLINSCDFTRHYNGQQHLLVRYNDLLDFKQKFISIVDDHTFPQQKLPLTVPILVSMLDQNDIIGTSNGLLCMYGYRQDGPCGTRGAVIWNPSIRKAVAVDVDVPNAANRKYKTVLGFGVCRETTDPKIVKITCIHRGMDIESISCVPWRVEVFTLSTRAWRSPYSNLPRTSIKFDYYCVVIDGVHWWLATDIDGGFRSRSLMVSFDMTSEEFREVSLPDGLAHQDYDLAITKLRESLVVLEYDEEANGMIAPHVWMMEDGFPKTFTKLFTFSGNVTLDVALVLVRGFRKTGEPIIEVELDHDEYPSLVVYEPYSKSITNHVGINGRRFSSLYAFTETLLLL